MIETDEQKFRELHIEQSLGELLAGKRSGFAIIDAFGKLTEVYGFAYPRIYSVQGGVATHHGVIKDGAYIGQTTLFEVYRNNLDLYKSMSEVYTRESAIDRPLLEPVADAVFCAFSWSINYQHFLIDVFPRIWLISQLRELDDLPIIVSDFSHVREIVNAAFPDRRFIFVKENEGCQVTDRLFFCGAVAANMNSPPSNVAIAALQHLRTSVLTGLRERPYSPKLGGAVFFSRRPDPTYAGNTRVMTNFDEVEAEMSRRGIVMSDFDYKNLQQKALQVCEIDTAISPVGSNLMNLIFAPLSTRMLILDHPVFHAEPFYTEIFAGIGFDVANIKCFATSEDGTGNTNDNTPYFVNLEAYKAFLDDELK